MTTAHEDEAPQTAPGAIQGARRPRRRARWWVAGAAVGAVALGGVALVTANALAAPPDAVAESRDFSTVPIERGTLSGSKTVPGVLDFANTRGVTAGVGGTLTGVTAPGTQVGRGGTLFAVDNVAVFLFLGELPMWRPFEADMRDGPDVRQLEQNLRDLEFFDFDADDDFTWDTQHAIRKWQEATGQEITGRIEQGRIVFAPSDQRIAAVLTSIGDPVGAGGAVINVSTLAQEITADLKLADQKLGVIGANVQVQLPGGASTGGTIATAGQPTERDRDGQKTVVIPLTITLDTPDDAAGIQRANVTVDIPSEIREDVLSVPVDALIALPQGGFGVEAAPPKGPRTQIPVETGLFASGRVEVSGKGVEEGLDVVVPTE